MTNSSDALLVRAVDLGLSFDGNNGAKDSRRILSHVSFDVSRGEIVALLGRSGAGKTSLLNIVAGFLAAQQGSLRFPSHAGAARPPFAYVFQEDRLLPWRTAAGNIGLALDRIGVPRARRRALALDALADVGLRDSADLYPWQLSGGMRSRVALARALALKAPLLLLDEPFGKLDSGTRAEMHDLLRSLRTRHEFGALMVTHDVDEAVALADRALVLRPGRPGLREVAWDSRGAPATRALRAALSEIELAPPAPASPGVKNGAGSKAGSNEGREVSRRAVLALGVTAFAATAASFSPRAWAASAAPVRVGYWATGIQLALIELIRERKLFEKHGLDYEFVRFADVNGNTLALATGRIDVAFSVAGTGALDLAARGRPIRIVLSTQAADGRLVTRNPDVRGLDDLRGRSVGMAPAGSAGAAYTHAFLAQNHGLESSAYKTVGGGEARLVQLLVQGEIDAALLREVSVAQFTERLKLRSLADQRAEWERLAGTGAVPPLGLGVVRQSILESRRDDAVRFIAAVIDGIRLGAAQPDLVSDLMARSLKLSADEARAYADTWGISFHGKFDEADVQSLDTAQKLFVANGSLEAAADRAFFDTSVYRDALARLG